tara:strand:- start:1576 stop:1965 length:390 start_codon:yes stop_codon:yes gene_type:complete
MYKLTLAIGSATILLAAGSAYAEHHEEAAPAANDNPDRAACMEMHQTMMARHEAGEDHDAIMASLSEEDQAQMTACREMMHADGPGNMEHGGAHADMDPGNHHGDMEHADGHAGGHEAGNEAVDDGHDH